MYHCCRSISFETEKRVKSWGPSFSLSDSWEVDR